MSRIAMEPLPGRDPFIVRGAYVLTMDEALGDIVAGDVAVQDGTIVAVGDASGFLLSAPDAQVIDGAGMIVLPGFVDTHWHLWNSLLRGVIGDGDRTYFAVKNRLAPLFTADDTYLSARMALADAATSGITTVNDWDHNVRGPDYADANARAILDSGLRARYSYGNADKLDPAVVMGLADILRFERDWTGAPGDGRITLGMAMRGPVRTERAVCLEEWAFARDHGLPMTMHCGGRRDESGRYCELEAMAADGLLGADLQVVHAVHATEREIELLASTGTHLSLSPLTEYRSMGIPPLGTFLDAGILVSLSIDTVAIPTTADMLLQMNVTLSVERARTGGPSVTPRQVIRMATLDGARDLGLGDRIGSLTPGKRADLIGVRLDSVNTAPAVDPVATLVYCARPSDVDLVVADGRIVKRDGQLTSQDPGAIATAATTALHDLVARSGWDIPLGIAADRVTPGGQASSA